MEDRAVAQAVSRRPLTAEARASSQTIAGDICGGQYHWDGFSQITSNLHANIMPQLLLTHLFIHYHRR
jgi:hypothetical protein